MSLSALLGGNSAKGLSLSRVPTYHSQRVADFCLPALLCPIDNGRWRAMPAGMLFPQVSLWGLKGTSPYYLGFLCVTPHPLFLPRLEGRMPSPLRDPYGPDLRDMRFPP